MAEETNADIEKQEQPGESEPSSGRKAPPLALILIGLNTLAVLGAIGFAYYSRVLYKKPVFRETSEREKLFSEKNTADDLVRGFYPVGPLTINIAPTPMRPKSEDTPRQIAGKLHYLTITFSMEIRDESKLKLLEEISPVLLDQINQHLGRRKYHELTTAQGRFIVKSDLIDMANTLLRAQHKDTISEDLVTNLFFTQYIVQ